MRRWCALPLLALVWVMLTATAERATAADDASERARISAERAAAETQFAERERECAGRFVVAACVQGAQREHRSALATLRQQETSLDEAQRKQRAAERLQRLSTPRVNEPRAPANVSPREAHVARPPRAASQAPRSPQDHAVRDIRPRKASAPRASGESGESSEPADPVDRQAQEATHRADFAARTQVAQGRRAAAAQRQAERLKKGHAAHPLPVPAGAVAP